MTERIETIDQLHEAKPPVRLTGVDGNAFGIIGACQKAARAAGASPELRHRIREEMTAQASYDDLLGWALEHFEVS